MPFAELLLYCVLLSEPASVLNLPKVFEDKVGFADNRYLVSILKLTSLITSDQLVIYLRTVAAQVLKDCSSTAILILREYEAKPVTYRRTPNKLIIFRVPSDQIAAY